MRVVLTGGGTGGHWLPFEPIIRALITEFNEQKKELPLWLDRSELEIFFLGVSDAKTKVFFDKLGVRVNNIQSGKLRRYPSATTISDILWRLPRGIVKAAWRMWWIMPDVVVSRGGYGSIPTVIAAILYRIPYMVHESDAAMSLSTNISLPGASVITLGMADTRHRNNQYQKKMVVTGMPIREGLMKLTAEEAKASFGFNKEEKVVLVTGGSQGAEQINTLLIQILPVLLPKAGVIHLAGEDNIVKVQQESAERLGESDLKNKYKLFGFLDETMGDAMMAADIVVSRAGATTLAELARLRKPAIVIPLSGAAQDHQRLNAEAYERLGAIRVIGDENLGKSLLEQNIFDLLENDEYREALRNNIAKLDHPNAAQDIANLAIKLAMGLAPRQQEGSEIKAERERMQKNGTV